jgi:hypothetical protein
MKSNSPSKIPLKLKRKSFHDILTCLPGQYTKKWQRVRLVSEIFLTKIILLLIWIFKRLEVAKLSLNYSKTSRTLRLDYIMKIFEKQVLLKKIEKKNNLDTGIFWF